MDCCCYPIDVREEIRFCAPCHRYHYGKRELASVSSVIKLVYAAKSWDGVDPDVVANARYRGEAVDRYMSEYIRYGEITVQPGERMDVIERLEIAVRIWEQHYGRLQLGSASSQVTVYNLDDGISGTADFGVYGGRYCFPVDLKCTYNQEVSWILQIGAYAEYMNADEAYIIHVSPKLYSKSGGGRLITYDAAECRRRWRSAVAWFKETKEMESAFKAGKKEKGVLRKGEVGDRLLVPLLSGPIADAR